CGGARASAAVPKGSFGGGGSSEFATPSPTILTPRGAFCRRGPIIPKATEPAATRRRRHWVRAGREGVGEGPGEKRKLKSKPARAEKARRNASWQTSSAS